MSTNLSRASRLALACLCGALGAGTPGLAAERVGPQPPFVPPPAPWTSVDSTIAAAPWARDFRLTPEQIAAYVAQLSAPRGGPRHEAQLRLAWTGTSGLDAVEPQVASGALRDTASVTEYLAIALLASVPPDSLTARPALATIARRWITEGDTIVGDPPRDPPLYHFERAYSPRQSALRGFALPAVARMCLDPRPRVRGRAVGFLGQKLAVTQLALLRRLRADRAQFGTWEDDYTSQHNLGDEAARTAASILATVTGRDRYEQFLDAFDDPRGPDRSSGLINGLRSVAHTLDQPTWDAWWDAARPVWNAWWERDLAGDEERRIAAWWDELATLQGCTLTRRRSAHEGVEIDLTGPPTIDCEVRLGDRVLAQGRPPLHVARSATSRAGAIVAGDAPPPDVEDRTLTLAVRRRGAASWTGSYRVASGDSLGFALTDPPPLSR